MKIGIVSDSHGAVEPLQRAARMLIDRGAEAIVHCGDLGSVVCLSTLGAMSVPTYAVAGNMDRRVDRLAVEAERCGVNFHRQLVEVPLGDGQHLMATHGDDERLLGELIAGGQFPYICHGHTHRVRDEKFGDVRVICPGALRHPRNPRHPTVALLDTETEVLEYIDV